MQSLMPPRHERGITLFELSAAMGIVAITAATALPSFQGLHDSRRLEGVARELATDIGYLRSEAVARGQRLRVRFQEGPAGSCYVIHTGAAQACDCLNDGPAMCEAGADAIKSVFLPSRQRTALHANVESMLIDPSRGTVTPATTVSLRTPEGKELRQVVNIMGRVRGCAVNGAVAGMPACEAE
jgi:type IV fimbrial biogenesis protein FimT